MANRSRKCSLTDNENDQHAVTEVRAESPAGRAQLHPLALDVGDGAHHRAQGPINVRLHKGAMGA